MTDRDWYSPNSINFSKAQVYWLLEHIEYSLSDSWPPEYKDTGYSGSRTKSSQRAPYENACLIWAELRERIEATGVDGLLMEMVYSNPEGFYYLVQHIANCMNIDSKTVKKRISTALRYITGKCPRYADCLGCPDCADCKRCRRRKRCEKKPRRGRTYQEFRDHKKRR